MGPGCYLYVRWLLTEGEVVAAKRLVTGGVCALLTLAGAGCGTRMARESVRASGTSTSSSLRPYADVASAAVTPSSRPSGGFVGIVTVEGQSGSSSHLSSTSGRVGPAVSRPSGKGLPAGTNLATAPTGVIQQALQADFTGALAGGTGYLAFDAATNAANAKAFFAGQQSRLSLVSIVPTVTSTSPLSDGSLVVYFTAVVKFMGATWPTNFGVLTATLTPHGTMIPTHASLCDLASAMIIPTCPF